MASITKDLLIEQFSNSFDQNGWFVAVRNALDGVSAAEAASKPAGVDNSIREIVSHLNYYNYAYVERFKGVGYQYPADDNDATFDAKAEVSDEAWKAEIAK